MNFKLIVATSLLLVGLTSTAMAAPPICAITGESHSSRVDTNSNYEVNVWGYTDADHQWHEVLWSVDGSEDLIPRLVALNVNGHSDVFFNNTVLTLTPGVHTLTMYMRDNLTTETQICGVVSVTVPAVAQNPSSPCYPVMPVDAVQNGMAYQNFGVVRALGSYDFVGMYNSGQFVVMQETNPALNRWDVVPTGECQ